MSSDVPKIIDFSSPVPIVFRGRADVWDQSSPILDKLLSGEFRDVRTQWRICPLKTKRSIREYESVFITATFEEFDEWYKGTILPEDTSEGLNPFRNVPRRSDGVVSVYADYKHFSELFSIDSIPSYGSMIDLYGKLPEKSSEKRGEEDSEYDKLLALFAPENLTLWLSTHGAHTPLHYDTYGCNVVTQVKGSKRWQLWSPNSVRQSGCSSVPSTLPATTPSSSSHSSFAPTSHSSHSSSSSSSSSSSRMQNSSCLPISSSDPASRQKDLKLSCLRIPYEESSVYSTYDPRLRDSNIVGFIPPNYDITLNEGDVLYVPKHYWHFVETSSAISLSINLWLPFPMPAQASFSQFERNTVVKSDEEVHTIAGKEEDKASIMTSNAHHNESVIVADVHTLKSLSKIDIEKNSMEEIFPFVANCEPSGTNSSSKKVEFEQSSSGNNRDLGPCVDPQSRVIEALSRVLYGALKGTASRVFDTDSPRSGWINPSEQGGTLDFSAWNLPLSSNSREECEMSEKRNNGDDDDDDKIRDNLGPRSSDDDSDSSCSDEDVGEVRMRKVKKWQLMDKNAKLHLEYLYMSLEEKRLEDEKQEKRSVDDKKEKEIDFEGFLKRFFNALLDPENIERCLIASTDK